VVSVVFAGPAGERARKAIAAASGTQIEMAMPRNVITAAPYGHAIVQALLLAEQRRAAAARALS
jgi:hypothetical protein